MGPNVLVRGGESNALADWLAGSLAMATLGLFTNDVNPGVNADKTAFTAATFTGSAPVAATWGTPYLNANGDWEVQSQLINFHWTAGTTESVYGIMLQSAGTGTPLLVYARLDASKSMGLVTDVLSIVVRLTMSALGFGASIQVSE